MTAASRTAVLRRTRAHLLVADISDPMPDAAQSHHLLTVLRLGDGDEVSVTDGRGGWRICELDGPRLRGTGVAGSAPPPPAITIGVAIPKLDRPEWIVQKLTEIGVPDIVLLHTQRSVVRWDPGRAGKKLEKLNRVAVEALQQSRGVWLPTVSGPLDVDALLPDAYIAEPGGGRLGDVVAAVVDGSGCTLLVGPEGGWTVDEVGRAKGRFDLGATVLRVETAAIAVAVRTLSVVG